jgi:hypothetical protein
VSGRISMPVRCAVIAPNFSATRVWVCILRQNFSIGEGRLCPPRTFVLRCVPFPDQGYACASGAACSLLGATIAARSAERCPECVTPTRLGEQAGKTSTIAETAGGARCSCCSCGQQKEFLCRPRTPSDVVRGCLVCLAADWVGLGAGGATGPGRECGPGGPARVWPLLMGLVRLDDRLLVLFAEHVFGRSALTRSSTTRARRRTTRCCYGTTVSGGWVDSLDLLRMLGCNETKLWVDICRSGSGWPRARLSRYDCVRLEGSVRPLFRAVGTCSGFRRQPGPFSTAKSEAQVSLRPTTPQ